MLSSFRRLSKSKVGTVILVAFLLAILASFALADISNLSSGGSLPQNTLAKVGDVEVTSADLDTIMQRRLAQIRQENPQATYADLAGDFDTIVNSLIQERTLYAYAQKHGFTVSKKLVDAEIVKIPAVRGLDGRFSEQAYRAFLSQQRLTDQQLRREIETALLQRLVLTPVAANTRLGQGIARPYADLLLEKRDGELGLLPFAAFTVGAAPTNAELQGFYRQNAARYTVPERRVFRIARMTAEQLGNVAPTEQEIAAYYNANKATYGGEETRVLSRLTTPDQAQANGVAARAKAGGTFAAAAAPAGFSAADVSLGPQSKAQLTSLAGAAVANQVFAAPAGTVIGPVRSSTGFDVIKVESISAASGRSLDQARAEIVAKLMVDKRKEALADLVGKVEDELADGRTFEEVAQANKLPVVTTPPLTRAGTNPDQPTFRLQPEYAQLPGQGFDIGADDEPVVETLPNDSGYALLDVTDVIAAAPAPLARIADQVRRDLIAKRASDRAAVAATQVMAAMNKGTPMAQAIAALKLSGVKTPERISLRRADLAQFANQGQEVPPPLRILFTLAPGKSQRAAGQTGIYLVHLNQVTPGNAATNPTLVAQELTSLNRLASEELALQWLTAAQKELGVTRNEDAIKAARQRITGGAVQ